MVVAALGPAIGFLARALLLFEVSVSKFGLNVHGCVEVAGGGRVLRFGADHAIPQH